MMRNTPKGSFLNGFNEILSISQIKQDIIKNHVHNILLGGKHDF